MYGRTAVQDQCSIVALYYYITSLPVYPTTVPGHGTTVVVDTSNRVYCIDTLMDARYSVVQILQNYMTLYDSLTAYVIP